MADRDLQVAEGYDELLRQIKERIRQARVRAALAVNRELVLLYWGIGRDILERQKQEGWGTKVVARLAGDLRRGFPEMKGLSPRNIKYMRAFAAAWPSEPFVQQVAAQIPWFHNCVLLDKLQDAATREWYMRATVEHGWSRNVLVHQIESGLHRRHGQAVTNFGQTLPAPQSDLARELLKDPYNFDFLALADDYEERALERGLLEHLRDFLLELGAGFAFIGSQYPLVVDGQDFYLDLLFYHARLHCYVVVELKAGEFKPEYAGKLNFYLAVVDDILRSAVDAPTIGILLCRSKSRLVAEYALRGMTAPMGVSEYQLAEALPAELQGALPSIAELEAGLADAAEGEEE